MALRLRAKSQPARIAESLRKWQRVAVAVPADLFSLEGERTALVLNLSSHGAMVEMPLPPSIGAEVVLHCGAIEAGGEVVWRMPTRCGIWFHYPISAEEIDSEVHWSRTEIVRLLTR
jgi:hypothetical protein